MLHGESDLFLILSDIDLGGSLICACDFASFFFVVVVVKGAEGCVPTGILAPRLVYTRNNYMETVFI